MLLEARKLLGMASNSENTSQKGLQVIQGLCVLVLTCDVLNFFLENQLLLIMPKVLLLAALFRSTRSILLLLFSSLLLLSILIQSFNTHDVNLILMDAAFGVKVILFFYSLEYFLDKKTSVSDIGVKIVLAFFVFNVLLTWLGIGLTSYGRLPSGIPIGSKGIYQSGNEFGIAFFFIVALLLHGGTNWIRAILSTIIGVAIATKVALVAVLLIIYHWLKPALRRHPIFVGLLIVVFSSMVVFPLLLDYIGIRFASDFNSSSNMVSFLLSGRDLRIVESLNSFAEASTLSVLFGVPFHCVASVDCSNLKFVENDLVDFLLIYGVVTWVVIVSLIGRVLLKAWRINQRYFRAIFFLFGISFLSGHVLYNPLLPTILALAFQRARS